MFLAWVKIQTLGMEPQGLVLGSICQATLGLLQASSCPSFDHHTQFSIWVCVKMKPPESRWFWSMLPLARASHLGLTLFLTTTAIRRRTHLSGHRTPSRTDPFLRRTALAGQVSKGCTAEAREWETDGSLRCRKQGENPRDTFWFNSPPEFLDFGHFSGLDFFGGIDNKSRLFLTQSTQEVSFARLVQSRGDCCFL